MKRIGWGISLLMLVSGAANAALVSRLSGAAYYDTVLDITWLADANHAYTSGYDSDGLMTWSAAQTWISTLNASSYLGITNWRLPNADVNSDNFVAYCSSSTEPVCRDNEMGYMFYQNHVNRSLPAPFASIGFDYWSGTVNPANSAKAYDGLLPVSRTPSYGR
jgi:hypothetical protein